jgi:hypothetical protein
MKALAKQAAKNYNFPSSQFHSIAPPARQRGAVARPVRKAGAESGGMATARSLTIRNR